MKTNMYTLDGKKSGDIELPTLFETVYRPEIISKAFHAERSHSYQPAGADPRAGLRTSAESWATGGGRHRVPRVKAGPHRAGRGTKGHRYRSKGRWFRAAGRASIAPHVRGGRQAHPPKSQEILVEKINKREFNLAMRSALAATLDKGLVEARGHRTEGVETLPLIVEDKLHSLKKTKEVLAMLNALGLQVELDRVAERRIRAGRGKTRGRKYKIKRGPLMVVGDESDVLKAAKNLRGVDITTPKELGIAMLAPGSTAGRLVVITEGAVKGLGERFA